jgi:hypothetical protein
MKWAGHVAHMERDKVIQNLVGKHEGKRPFGRPRCRQAFYIRMDLREIGWEGVDGMHLAQDKDQWRGLLNTAINPQFS